ncbi:hypothetical protein OKW41_005988 [Paraburkholderia sp. UCT70]|uniref:hypothetical protein n=1 Tax=Paraburkholderia sp. UCT70 TaxID=2991068 RepID=UPI003D190ED5
MHVVTLDSLDDLFGLLETLARQQFEEATGDQRAQRGTTFEERCTHNFTILHVERLHGRDHDRDMTAVNAGFLDAFVAKALAPPKPVPLRTMTDAQLCDEAKRLTISIHGLDRAASIAKLEQVRTQQRGGHAA